MRTVGTRRLSFAAVSSVALAAVTFGPAAVAAPTDAAGPQVSEGSLAGSVRNRIVTATAKSRPGAIVEARAQQSGCTVQVRVDWDDEMDTPKGRDAFRIRVTALHGKKSKFVDAVNRTGNEPDGTYRLTTSKKACPAVMRANKVLVAISQQHDGNDKDKLYEKNAATVLTLRASAARSGANLSDGSGLRDCSGIKIEPSADLHDCDLRSVGLRNADLRNASLIDADMSNDNLNGANLSGAWLTSANLYGAYVSGANLRGVKARYANMRLLSAIGTDLTSAQLDYATLDQAEFDGGFMTTATLDSTSLVNVKLLGIDVSGATLTNASLMRGDLTGSSLAYTKVDQANLAGATLTGVKSGGITGVPAAMPTGWKVTVGYILGPGVNLTGARLTDGDLGDVNLTGATLDGVTSGNITGTPTALPTDWQLYAGYLIGPRAIADGANLTGLDLSRRNLRLISMQRAILRDVNFKGATLDGANLVGADMTNTVMTDAQINDADLTGATLYGVTSGGVGGGPRNMPDQWSVINGNIVGPRANLRGAYLFNEDGLVRSINVEGADLTNADFANSRAPGSYPNSNFNNANLTGVDLTNVNVSNSSMANTILTGATVEGADFSGIDLSTVVSGGLQGSPGLLPPGWSIVGGYFVQQP